MQTPTFYTKLNSIEQRLYMMLHYVDENTLIGFSIHHAFKSNKEADWRDLVCMLKEQVSYGGSPAANVKKVLGEECYELLNQINTDKDVRQLHV